MIKQERKKWLEERLLVDKKVDIDETAKQLNVSSMTIRRDLDALEKEGKLIRTYGGAVTPQIVTEDVPYVMKKDKNTEQKKEIAQMAISLIKSNATVILDSGTTTLEIAKLIKLRDDLTIVTNDIKIAAELLDGDLHVIVTGGELQKHVGSLFGIKTQNVLSEIHADLAFMGTHAVDIEFGVTAPTFEKSLIKKMMINGANKAWLLADASKFDKKAFSQVYPLEKVEGIITDKYTDIEIINRYSKKVKMLKGGD